MNLTDKKEFHIMQKYKHLLFDIPLFSEMKALANELKNKGIRFGLILPESQKDTPPLNRTDLFETVIYAEDPPMSNPIIKYIETTGAHKEEILTIGSTIQHSQYAKAAGVDWGLALWECMSVKHLYATYYFSKPEDIPYLLAMNPDPFGELPWLKWAMELQFISQAGTTYSKDAFDVERFERLKEISAEIMSLKTGISKEQVKDVFCNETGFQTPKLDTRAAIFEDDKILLVKEKNGTWSLPGGWVDVNESIKSNTIKEAKEESGLDVLPVRLIAIQDRNKHNLPLYAYGISKAFVLCEIVGGSFTPNVETERSEFFGLAELPPLALEKNNEDQIKLCFDAYHSNYWEPVFD